MIDQKPSESSSAKQKFFYGYIIVAASLLIIILDYGARLTFGVFFKPMSGEFDWTRTLMSGAFTISTLIQGVGSIFMGRFNDKVGPKFVMTFCGAIFGMGYLLMSLVTNVWQMYVIYGVVIGVGMSGAFVALLSTVARWFVKRRGIMTGIVIAGVGLGTFIIPPIASWLIAIYGWRLSYLVLGGVVLIIGVLAAQVLRRDPSKIGLVPYGEQIGGVQRVVSGDQGLSLGEAAHTRQFWLALITFFCLGYSVFTVNIHLVPAITDLGISAATAATIFGVTGAFTAVGCILMGFSIDRIGSRRVAIICFTLLTVSTVWLVTVKEVWVFYLYAVVFGIGSGGGAPVESTITAELFGLKSHGAIFGVISLCFTVGSASGPFVSGYLFDVTGSYTAAFFVAAAAAAIGILFSVFLRPVTRPALEPRMSQ